MTFFAERNELDTAIRRALLDARMLDANGNLTRPLHELAACLVIGAQNLPDDRPWGEPFVKTVGCAWVDIDKDVDGDVQMRVTENGPQFRLRRPTERCAVTNHVVETCTNCWELSTLAFSQQWYPITTSLQVRASAQGNDLATIRVEIRRRQLADEPQLESIWSEPWPLPSVKVGEDTWRQAAPAGDVQITDSLSSWGLLVRRATGKDDVPWTTPHFVEISEVWKDVLEDGSLQARQNPEKTYQTQIRQRVARKGALVFEPLWEKSESSHGQSQVIVDGYTLSPEKNHLRSFETRNCIGIYVAEPSGRRRRHCAIDKYLLVGPNLRVMASSDGYFQWQRGLQEPQSPSVVWSIPERRTLTRSEWTMLSATVRVLVVGQPGGVYFEVLDGDQWRPLGTAAFGATYQPEMGLCVTLHPDHVAEIQYAVTPA